MEKEANKILDKVKLIEEIQDKYVKSQIII